MLSLYGIIYVTWYTKSYQRHIPVAFGIPDHVTYQTLTRHALLGSGRPPKTQLMLCTTGFVDDVMFSRQGLLPRDVS